MRSPLLLLVLLSSSRHQLGRAESEENETCDIRGDDDADDADDEHAHIDADNTEVRRPDPPPGFRPPRRVHGFHPPIALPLLSVAEAGRAAAEVHALREHWIKQVPGSDGPSKAMSAEAQRSLYWYTLGPASAYGMEQDAYYGRQVGVVAPLLRARLGFVYDAVLARLSAHLNETVAWKADCGVPGLHIYPVGLAAETGANIQEMYTPPHTDGLHTGKRWPPWVEVNALPHYTISATVAVQLPAKVNATGLRTYPFYWNPFAERFVTHNDTPIAGNADSDLWPEFSAALKGGGGKLPHAYFMKLNADGAFNVHHYKTGGLSVHSGDEYHCIHYPGPTETAKGDWRITLQVHGMWTGFEWQLFW